VGSRQSCCSDALGAPGRRSERHLVCRHDCPLLQPSRARTEAVRVDEIDNLPSGADEANLFFNVVAKRYERGSMVLTSNLSFTQCAGSFADDRC
jgi:hypothetical protein